MNRCEKSQWAFWCLLPNFTRYGLILSLSVVMLADAVGATPKSRGLQIAQQPETTQQNTTRAAAERLSQEGMQLFQQETAESLRQAIAKYQEALKLWQQVDDKHWEAATLVGIGAVYDLLGENQEALKYYNQALPILRAVGNREGEAGILVCIGGVYNNLGENQEALKYYNQALPIHRAVGDKGGEASTLSNIGLVYDSLGEKQEALKYYNQALPIRRAVGDKGGEATTLSNIGLVYNSSGEKQEALKYLNQALPILRAVGDRRGEASTLSNIGLVYDSLGENQEALKYYNQALPIRRAVGDRRGEATTLSNIGGFYNDLGEKQEALKYLNQALPIRRAVGDKGGEATTLNSIGNVYYSLGEKQEALKYYNLALPIRRAVGDRGGEATTLNNIGAVYNSLEEKQEALKYYNQALPINRAVGDKEGEAATLGNIASLERDRGNLQQALTQVEAAIKIIEDLRTKVDSQELRASYFASQQGVYKFYIDLLMQLHKKDPSKGYDALALHISERSRARGLLELLTEANANIRKGVDPQLLAEEQDLRQKIDATAKLRQELPTQKAPTTVIQKLEQESANLLNQYRELQTKIRTTSPKYAALKYPDPLKLPQIQQQLDQDTLLLQYSLGEERSYLWAVTPNSLNTYELPGKEAIEKSAGRFQELLKKCQYVKCQDLPEDQKAKDLQEISQAATQLSKLVLAPVAEKLGKKRLVIVADGALQEIPFAALSEPNQKSNYQPLLVNHEIVNLPSVTAIAIHRQDLKQRQPAPKTLAVLADPVFAANDQRFTGKPESESPGPELSLQRSSLQRSAKNLKRGEWGRLPGTLTEANQILKLVSPDQSLKAFDFDANYNWATSEKLKQYRFILFATHGFADPLNPELSGIILSQIDKQGKPQTPGILRLGDIFNLDWNADVVVLSACETGLGKDVQGEGLMGLTRGLMYAGARTAVVSLWQVNDTATSKLMPQFYTTMLQQKVSPTIALRESQLKLWQQKAWQNPYYWAAFTLQGEWRN
ncbi:CHAT domain-containing protein [Nostoc sp. DedVER01b]|uniref:CHAT domain-containing protein n=1 Tax=Nostoc sp. DedVER01b TaxID=3075404 RepID=UPI002AD3B5AB|nr:CHAT domain-containing tetratricopeptide repeat protein [Nostoc sp. DedVER01b]MDZ8111303.1 CHAT domain-containing tetratricopeptide repeat protein [Nostoc sp. DedVER01b]